MTGVRTRSFWHMGVTALSLGAGVACTNDRFVVIGRLHPNEVDASLLTDAAPTSEESNTSPSSTLATESSLGASSSTPLDAGSDLSTTEPTSAGVTSVGADAGCSPALPTHRYSFAGMGTQATNVSGGSPATLRGGAELTNLDSLTLDGEDDFVALPTNLLQGLTSVSVMLWVRYDGGPAYVRLFDFGSSSAGIDPPEGEASVGRSYLAVTPATGYDPPGLTALVAIEGSGSEVLAASDEQIGDEMWHQVTVVLDGDTFELRLYLDGTRVAEADVEHSAAEITAANNWLGRSQYDADPYTQLTYDEVRVYASALSDCAVGAAFDNGPNSP